PYHSKKSVPSTRLISTALSFRIRLAQRAPGRKQRTQVSGAGALVLMEGGAIWCLPSTSKGSWWLAPMIRSIGVVSRCPCCKFTIEGIPVVIKKSPGGRYCNGVGNFFGIKFNAGLKRRSGPGCLSPHKRLIYFKKIV